MTSGNPCRKAAKAASSHSRRVSEKIRMDSFFFRFNDRKPRPIASICCQHSLYVRYS